MVSAQKSDEWTCRPRRRPSSFACSLPAAASLVPMSTTHRAVSRVGPAEGHLGGTARTSSTGRIVVFPDALMVQLGHWKSRRKVGTRGNRLMSQRTGHVRNGSNSDDRTNGTIRHNQRDAAFPGLAVGPLPGRLREVSLPGIPVAVIERPGPMTVIPARSHHRASSAGSAMGSQPARRASARSAVGAATSCTGSRPVPC